MRRQGQGSRGLEASHEHVWAQRVGTEAPGSLGSNPGQSYKGGLGGFLFPVADGLQPMEGQGVLCLFWHFSSRPAPASNSAKLFVAEKALLIPSSRNDPEEREQQARALVG